MSKKKEKKPFDPEHMTPEEQLKFEIAEELGGRSGPEGWLALPDLQGKRQDRRPHHKKEEADAEGNELT